MKNHTLLVLFCLLATTHFCSAQNVWQGKKCAVVLTYDDAYGIIYGSRETDLSIKVEYNHETLTFQVWVQDEILQAIDMQNIVAQFTKLDGSDNNINISNDGKLYVELKTIRKLQHENRWEDIYADGKVIPLSKFDWLIQKQEKNENMTHQELKNQVQTLIGKARTHDAMVLIEQWAHENNQTTLKNDVVILKGKQAALARQQNLGAMDYAEFSREQVKLNTGVLSLFDDLVEPKTVVATLKEVKT